MLSWKKLGQIFKLSKSSTPVWMCEQAQNPFAVVYDSFIRVYFNTRPPKDKDGKSTSYAGFVDFKKDADFSILKISNEPLLELGDAGTFDEFGIMAGSILRRDKEYWLYYCGWTRMISTPYNWSIGLAISKDDGTSFNRIGRGPIIGPSFNEPYLLAGCSSVFLHENKYHMFYTSGINWIKCGNKYESLYQIMHAVSLDGVNWTRDGIPCIRTVINDEAQASPSVFFLNNKWHMIFSFRHSTDFRNKERGYRLGYAWSENLVHWSRCDDALNLNVSDSGWDSEMMCYPNVTAIDGKFFLFYCGNDFGKTGFGIAELIDI